MSLTRPLALPFINHLTHIPHPASPPLPHPSGFAYDELKADGRQCPVHVYVSTADVDSCCAFRILKSMMCSDGIPFSAYPVSGYQELQSLGEKLPKDGMNRSIVLINCGGTMDVRELLGERPTRRATPPFSHLPLPPSPAPPFLLKRKIVCHLFSPLLGVPHFTSLHSLSLIAHCAAEAQNSKKLKKKI